MKSLRFAFGVFLIVAVVFGMTPHQTQAAQQALPTTTIQEPWSITLEQGTADGTGDVVVLSGTNDNLILGYVSNGSTSDDPIADVLGEVVSFPQEITDIDRGANYALQGSIIDDVPYGHFSLIFPDSMPGVIEVHTYISPVSTFATGLDTLRESVTIDGTPLFAGVDGAALQIVLAGAAGSGNAIADSLLAPVLGESDGAEEIQDLTIDLVDHAKYAEAGVIAANTWVSPTFAVEVVWSNDWMLHPDDETPSAGRDEGGSEYVSLVRKDDPTVRFGVAVFPTSVKTIDTWVGELEFMLSMSPINTIVMAESYGEGGGLIGFDPHWGFVHDFSISDTGDAVVWEHLRTPIETLQDDVDSAGIGITMNGQPVLANITPADIGAVLP